jgi:hypothetical protein
MNHISINVNVFDTLMENMIGCNVKRILLSQLRRAVCRGICRSWRRVRNHTTSQQVDVIALYSALAEDQETMVCFLDFQEIKELSRKMQ